jgi:hypothetical protein
MHIIRGLLPWLIALATVLSSHSQAAWLAEPEATAGSLKLAKEFAFSPGESHENSLAAVGLGFQGGYEFANHLFLKAGSITGETQNLLGWQDRIKFHDTHVATGINWPLSKRWQLSGAVGLSHWRFTAKDQASLQKNAAETHFSGTDAEYRLGTQLQFNRLLSMGVFGGEKCWGDVRYVQYGLSLIMRFE